MSVEKQEAIKKTTLFAVFFLALVVRLIHNGSMMASPLYDFPLGGHVPYLVFAQKIANGNLFPFDAPFSINSPLYPYILAFLYRIVGVENFFLVRICGVLADSLTCVFIVMLAFRHFGFLAGIISGMVAAFYGPMVFYASELTPVPYTLFLITLSILFLDRGKGIWDCVLSGIFMGLAVGTRPNLVVLGVLLMTAPFLLKRKIAWFQSALFGIGVIAMILPITIANYTVSGKFILLTGSAGHNFYIGHNPQSTAGYSLPAAFDGDIFKNMKNLAQKAENRVFEDHEVSPYYMKKAFLHIFSSPSKELSLLWQRFLASVNDHEATTYANYYYQEEISPVLDHCMGFGLLFSIAVMGMLQARRQGILLFLPVLASFLTIFLFFYIARLRMPMVPFLIVFAGGGVSFVISCVKNHQFKRALPCCLAGIAGYGISTVKLAEADASNEWNKAGVVLRLQKKYGAAEKAFLEAMRANPNNPNVYLNLGVLYDSLEKHQKAKEAYARAKALMTGEKTAQFIEHLKAK